MRIGAKFISHRKFVPIGQSKRAIEGRNNISEISLNN